MDVDVQSSDKVFGQLVMDRQDVELALAEGPAQRGPRRYLMVCAVGLVFIVATSQLSGQPTDWIRYAPFGGGAVFLTALLIVSKRLAAKRVLEGKASRDLDMKLELDADGYSIASPSSDSRSLWRSVHHFEETKSAFLIYLNPSVHQIWPKRAFEAADLPRVRALLDAHVKPAVRLKRRGLLLWVALIIMFSLVYHLVEQFRMTERERADSAPERAK